MDIHPTTVEFSGRIKEMKKILLNKENQKPDPFRIKVQADFQIKVDHGITLLSMSLYESHVRWLNKILHRIFSNLAYKRFKDIKKAAGDLQLLLN